MFGAAGHCYYYYFNSVGIFVICLHFVPSCFFFDNKLCSICIIQLNLCAHLATGPVLLSLHIGKLQRVGLYHEYNQEQIICLINFSSTICNITSAAFRYDFIYSVFSTILMLFDILLSWCLCNWCYGRCASTLIGYGRCASTLIIKSWVEISGIIIIIIIIIIISFMQSIYTCIHETNYVPREYSVAAILLLVFMVLISLVSVLNLLYFYFSTFRSMCAVPNMAVFCSLLLLLRQCTAEVEVNLCVLLWEISTLL